MPTPRPSVVTFGGAHALYVGSFLQGYLQPFLILRTELDLLSGSEACPTTVHFACLGIA